MLFTTAPEFWSTPPQGAVRLGFDLASIGAIADSLRRFGRRFTDRLFTSAELDYAVSGHGLCAERLAARFAAKEAVIKALGLSETGVNWRDIEVVKAADGAPGIALHGRAAFAAETLGVREILLSLSHDGDCAGAVVNVWLQPEPQNHSTPEEK